MGFNISDKTFNQRLNRLLAKAKTDQADSLSKLASGSKFSGNDPQPADRAIAESMEYKIRSLSASKRNINDAISLLQTAESSMTEINNMITRMKEINIAAASTTISDQERRYLFIEYEALHDEINRVALTTEFNGIPLLNGESESVPEEMVFRISDPFVDKEGFTDGEDINSIRFTGLKEVIGTTEGLGILSASDLLDDATDEDGIELEDVEEMLIPEDDDIYATTYDQASSILSTHRAVFGALQTRLTRAMDFIDVYQENIAAAKSRIADTDYAEEVVNMIEAKMRVNATTSLMSQSNINAQHTMQLLSTL